jgi:signal peptidase II
MDYRVGVGAGWRHRSPMTKTSVRSRTKRIGISVAIIVLVLDMITKWWAVQRLSDGSAIDLVGSLRFYLVYNRGMAFSAGTNLGPLIGLLAIVVIVILVRNLNKVDTLLSLIATGLIIGGATGNVVDRIFRGDGFMTGAVIDFIDLQWWPVFNIADIGIVFGAIAMAISLIFFPAPTEEADTHAD